MRIEKHIRSVIASMASLTYHPLFKIGSRVFDILPWLLFREMRKLPPNYMRIRIGVGNRVFANQVIYLTAAQNFWYYMLAQRIVNMKSHIVDIGVGCGRYAHHLRDYDFKGEKYSGHYYGVDIDQELLGWCKRNFDSKRFSFIHSSHASKTYENTHSKQGDFTLPVPESSVDLVFSTSLYTHLLEEEALNYTREAFRILKPGGHMGMYIFSMDNPPPTFGDRHTFAHRIGAAYVESAANPEAAVAYEEQFLIDMAKQAGFANAKVVTISGEAQPMLFASKEDAISDIKQVA